MVAVADMRLLLRPDLRRMARAGDAAAEAELARRAERRACKRNARLMAQQAEHERRILEADARCPSCEGPTFIVDDDDGIPHPAYCDRCADNTDELGA